MNEVIDIEQDRASLEASVKLATKLKTIMEMDEFEDVFQEVYIKNFAITNAMNCSHYDAETLARMTRKMQSRSDFSVFIAQVLQEGQQANEVLKDMDIEVKADQE